MIAEPQVRVAKVLPTEAREILRRAISAKYTSEFARQKAIDAAIRRVKALYPEHFNQE